MSLTFSQMLPLGAKAPNFELEDVISGASISLESGIKYTGTLIMFICNHCPYVKHYNDEIAQICHDHPERFMAFATLPFVDSDRTIKELERCIDELKFQGACIGSNINGMALDNPRLYPFYERMSEFDLPIHIHPRTPTDKETYRDYRLVPMIGFEMDQQSIHSWIDETDIFGISLKGGMEIKPGFKDYDELADILEEIEID